MPLNVSRFVVLFTLLFSTMGLWAQSYVKEFAPPGSDRSTAKVLHFEDDHYFLFRALAEEDNDSKTNRLQIVEYDHCGVVASNEIYLEDFFSIRMRSAPFYHRDSIRIPVSGNTHLSNHREAGLLSIDPLTLNGRYMGVQGKNVMYSFNVVPYLEDQYIMHGFVSYIDESPKYVILKLDQNYKVLDYYHNIKSYTVSGSCIVRQNEIYFITSSHIVKFNSQLDPIWSKATSSSYYNGQSLLLEDGIAFEVKSNNGEGQTFVAKMDFDGRLVWKSRDLGSQYPRTPVTRWSRQNDGSLMLAMQEIDNDNVRQNITLSNIDVNNGNVLGEWEIGESLLQKASVLQDYISAPDGGVVCAQTPTFETSIVKFTFADELCPLLPIDQNQPSGDFEIMGEELLTNKTGPFKTDGIIFEISASEAFVENFCISPLPTFELIEDKFSLCGDAVLDVDLTSIPYSILWNDGSTDKLRSIDEPGIYKYEYEICDNYYGEEVIVENESCSCDWYIPNAFSPGGDSVNDEYRVGHSCRELIYFSIQIFNRWGGLMYSSRDVNFRWDGKWKGRPLMSGVYTYLLDYEDVGMVGERKREQGTIVLMR